MRRFSRGFLSTSKKKKERKLPCKCGHMFTAHSTEIDNEGCYERGCECTGYEPKGE